MLIIDEEPKTIVFEHREFKISPEEFAAFKAQMRRMHEATCNNWMKTHGKPMRRWKSLARAASRRELAEMRRERA